MNTSNDASLLSKQGMGGIYGGKGFKAQDAYLCIKLPYWFAEPHLTHVLTEGSGDIDIKLERDGRIERHYYQVKDHAVAPAEFREVLQQFADKQAADPSFARFVLVAGGLSPDVKALELALARVRGARAMHQGTPTYEATLQALRGTVIGLSLPVTVEWLLEHVDLEDSEHIRTWPNCAASLLNDFVGQTLSLQEFENSLRPALVRAFAALQVFVSENLGCTLARDDLLEVVRQAVTGFGRQTQAEGLGVFLDVWGEENAQARLPHDAMIDWRTHFDRTTRRVPSVEAWTRELLPELAEVQRRFHATGTCRHVIVRGGGPLTTGLAVGATFSAVKGYHLTIEQRGDSWESGAKASAARFVAADGLEMLGGNGAGLVVELNGVRQVRRKVDEYCTAMGLRFTARLSLQLEAELEKWTAADAVALAQSCRSQLVKVLDRHPFEALHLFFAVPFGFAVLLGHHLNSVGLVQSYEEQHEGGYAPSGRFNLG